MSGQYRAIPGLPSAGVEQWQAKLLEALKENVELLSGTRGEPGNPSAAVNRGSVTVAPINNPRVTRLSATPRSVGLPSGFRLSGSTVVTTGTVDVPVSEEFLNLVRDVQSLAYDVQDMRNALNTLIEQMKG